MDPDFLVPRLCDLTYGDSCLKRWTAEQDTGSRPAVSNEAFKRAVVFPTLIPAPSASQTSFASIVPS